MLEHADVWEDREKRRVSRLLAVRSSPSGGWKGSLSNARSRVGTYQNRSISRGHIPESPSDLQSHSFTSLPRRAYRWGSFDFQAAHRIASEALRDGSLRPPAAKRPTWPPTRQIRKLDSGAISLPDSDRGARVTDLAQRSPRPLFHAGHSCIMAKIPTMRIAPTAIKAILSQRSLASGFMIPPT